MGFRFRRRLRIMPGIYVNLSKTGGSLSIGGHGATLNVSRAGTRTTVGLPGSGLSYRSPTHHWGDTAAPPAHRLEEIPAQLPATAAPAGGRLLFWLGILATIAVGVIYLMH